MFNLVKKRTYFYIFSSALIVLSILSIFIWKLNFGIDFSGGSIIELSSSGIAGQIEAIKSESAGIGIKIDSASSSGNDKVILRTKNLTTDEHQKLIATITKVNHGTTESSYQTIGPVVSRDISNKAIWAVVVASLAIILFVAYAFRKVPKPASSWRFGLTAVAALIHDLIVTTGFVSVVGHYYSFMQVDALFITALLTVMGFSVHDTIVVFDRLRENMVRHPNSDIETLANDSILQTISRSINTSLTTIMVLLALFLIGGSSISHFVLILIAGITFGTYSSIFIATMLLISWQKTIERRKAGE
ncbi:MAG: protein translocase subunit SecF [Candidatus Berkelbacteria bacterium]|nr:protein translocase subunit SecF [Candidatus Berkelbacteria bacterium]